MTIQNFKSFKSGNFAGSILTPVFLTSNFIAFESFFGHKPVILKAFENLQSFNLNFLFFLHLIKKSPSSLRPQ